MKPVGEGARRVTSAPSLSVLGGYALSQSSSEGRSLSGISLAASFLRSIFISRCAAKAAFLNFFCLLSISQTRARGAFFADLNKKVIICKLVTIQPAGHTIKSRQIVRRELLPAERIRSVQRSLAAPAFCFFARAFAPFEEPEKPKAYRRGGNSRRYAEKRDKRVGSV